MTYVNFLTYCLTLLSLAAPLLILLAGLFLSTWFLEKVVGWHEKNEEKEQS